MPSTVRCVTYECIFIESEINILVKTSANQLFDQIRNNYHHLQNHKRYFCGKLGEIKPTVLLAGGFRSLQLDLNA